MFSIFTHSYLTSLVLLHLVSGLASAFKGNFELSNVTVASPCEADPSSTESSYVECQSRKPSTS
jgi:hypothetical protein